MTKRYFGKVETLEELRAEYKRLIKKYHPDNEGGSTEITQQINAEYAELFKILKARAEKKDDAKANYDYDNERDELFRAALNAIINIEGIEIEIIGCWIWVSGDTYSIKDTLKAAGYKWIAKRKMWAFHSEPYVKKGKASRSMDDLRNYYGSQTVKTEVRRKLTE